MPRHPRTQWGWPHPEFGGALYRHVRCSSRGWGGHRLLEAAMLTTNRPLIQRPWVIPLGLLTVGFVAYSLLPYLGLNPDNARVALRDGFPLHYPLLVAHIFLGSVALLAACLQVWPWLRQNHPTVHRRSGRVYVCVAVPA